MTLEELVSHCRPAAPGEDVPLLRLDGDDDVPGVVAWFGADRSRQAVRLVAGGEEAGVLERTAVYKLVASQSMGFGDADAAILPGRSTAWTVLELVCPEPGCPESPLYAVSYDAARPPRCAVHPAQVLTPR